MPNLRPAPDRRPATASTSAPSRRGAGVQVALLDELDRDLIGLAPVKQRIRDIAALLLVDKLRQNRAQPRSRRRCT
jgi:hypothetical protein